ncbi:MAG: sodium/solute symporter [Bacteroidota bacterium]
MKFFLSCVLIFLFHFPFGLNAQSTDPYPDALMDWTKFPVLPVLEGMDRQLGLGGAFSGHHNGVLIMAGGSNFPVAPPWEKGQKKWYDDIYVLEKKGKDQYEWKHQNVRLPHVVANGVAISTPDGLLCIGGRNAEQVYNDVWQLKWNADEQTIEVNQLTPLPKPLCFMAGTVLGDQVYLIGGMSQLNEVISLQQMWIFNFRQDGASWKKLKPIPAAGRLLPVVVAQNDGDGKKVYVISGQSVSPGKEAVYLTDIWQFDPVRERWKEMGNRFPDGTTIPSVFAAPGIAYGNAQVFIFSGVAGHINQQLAQLNKAASASDDQKEQDSLLAQRNRIYESHPGFSREILSYHTLTNSWTRVGTMPFMPSIITHAFFWDDGWIIPGGEISPGVRSPEINKVTFKARKNSLSKLNLGVLFLYFGVLLLMGAYFYRRQQSTNDYFKGGQRIPWWAAGLSLLGTSLSAITFMAVPAKAFSTDWSFFILSLTILLIPILVNRLFIPYYRQLNLTSAYEYLEIRYNRWVRWLGSLAFIFFQIGRIAVVLYLPAIAINVVTGFDIYWCITLVGLISILYTLMGGIEAVIWTDVLQVFILLGGALYCLFLLQGAIPGGFDTIVRTAEEQNKFNLFDLSFDWTKATFWVVLVGGFFTNLITYSTDQTMVQRYLTTTDTKAAQRSLWLNSLVAVLAAALFFFIGSALFVYYQQQPQLLQFGATQNDAIFPWYIVSQLPNGLSGILIAGILAASMSSLSSSMNSVATAYTTDFHQFLQKGKSNTLWVARWATLLTGLLGLGLALLMAGADIKSLWDEFIKIVGLITGGLGGIFLLGILSKRTSAIGALIGLLGSAIIQYFLAQSGAIHFLLYTVSGFLSCMALAYFTSFLFPRKTSN